MVLESYFPQIEDKNLVTEMTDELMQFKKFLNIPLTPLSPAAVNFEEAFSAGSQYQQKIFIARIKLYNEIFASGLDPEKDLNDSRFLWGLFGKFKLRPPADLMTKVDMSNYVEIRDSNGVQVFGNFNFLKVLSYSIEDLFWYPWDQLFSRDEKITAKIMEAFIKSVSTAVGPFDPQVPEHVCWEQKSIGKYKASVKMNLFSPLFTENGKPDYMIATSVIKRFI